MENFFIVREVFIFGIEGECDLWIIFRSYLFFIGSEGFLVSSSKCIICIVRGVGGGLLIKFCGG